MCHQLKTCRNTINALVVKPVGSFLVCVLHVINYWYSFTPKDVIQGIYSLYMHCDILTCLRAVLRVRGNLSMTRTFGSSALWKK
jgi:hypothetical protein